MTSQKNKTNRPLHCLLIAVVLAAIGFIYSSHHNWYYIIGPLHSLDLGYPFADMQARLGIAEAINHGIDVNNEHNPFTPSGALNNKPLYTVTIMALLSLKTSHSVAMGILFGSIYIAWSLWLLSPSNWKETIIGLGILLSPPCLLLLERGNDDIIIYAFAMALPLLLETGRIRGKVISWLVISLLTPIKYYPAALYALFMHRPKSLKEFGAYVGASIIFICGLLWLIQEEMKTLSERIPSPPTNTSFGKTLLFDCLDFQESNHFMAFLICATLVSIIALAFLFHPKIQKKVETSDREELYFLVGSSVLTFCFLANGNWDYRLAFLIPTIPLTFTLLRGGQKLTRNLSILYLGSIFLTLWPEYLYFLSVIEPEKESWTLNLDIYQRYATVKHIASWLMISVNTIIATLILKNSILELLNELLRLFGISKTIGHTRT